MKNGAEGRPAEDQTNTRLSSAWLLPFLMNDSSSTLELLVLLRQFQLELKV